MYSRIIVGYQDTEQGPDAPELGRVLDFAVEMAIPSSAALRVYAVAAELEGGLRASPSREFDQEARLRAASGGGVNQSG